MPSPTRRDPASAGPPVLNADGGLLRRRNDRAAALTLPF